MSDVNFTSHLLLDAFRNDYEAAAAVSNDSDLVERIRIVRQEFRKRVVVLFPCRPGRHGSNELRRVAPTHLAVDPPVLQACQFPSRLTDGWGTIHKPAGW